MNTIYISKEEFWEWFDRDPSKLENNKRIKTDKSPTTLFVAEEKKPFKAPSNKRGIRNIVETEAAENHDSRYIIMFGRHRPGKRTKVWEGDGYLSLVGSVAHICDLNGKMLEEPTFLDEIDMATVREFGELLIGDTEVAVLEVDSR